MNATCLARRFEEIIGWPYASPGSNDQQGIDCSGAFVRAFAAEGQSIYHGSNRIARSYCTRVVALHGSAQELRVGCAVFKTRADASALPACYQPGGERYDPAFPLDFYHIGLVTAVHPLRIVHATTPCAKVDQRLGEWSHAGFLTGVQYEEAEEMVMAYVNAESGTTVNLRRSASRKSVVLARLQVGTCVRVLEEKGDWARVAAEEHTGWMMRAYLASDAAAAADDAADIGLEQRLTALETRVAALENESNQEDTDADVL